MSGTGSVGGRERLRLFCALTLPAGVQGALGAWQRDSLRCDARLYGARLVERAHLHITLAFLGHRPTGEVGAVAEALGEAASGVDTPIVLSPLRYRETRSVGMLVLADEATRAGQLALALHERLESLGLYKRERRPWLPHVTVLRFRRRPGLRPPVPSLAPFGPSEAAVYHSVLRSSGAQYEVLQSIPIGG